MTNADGIDVWGIDVWGVVKGYRCSQCGRVVPPENENGGYVFDGASWESDLGPAYTNYGVNKDGIVTVSPDSVTWMDCRCVLKPRVDMLQKEVRSLRDLVDVLLKPYDAIRSVPGLRETVSVLNEKGIGINYDVDD